MPGKRDNLYVRQQLLGKRRRRVILEEGSSQPIINETSQPSQSGDSPLPEHSLHHIREDEHPPVDDGDDVSPLFEDEEVPRTSNLYSHHEGMPNYTDHGVMGGVEGHDESDVESDRGRAEQENEAIFDLNSMRYGDADNNIDHTVRSALNPIDVAGAAAYEEAISNNNAPTAPLDFDEEEEGDIDLEVTAQLATAAHSPFIPPPNPSLAAHTPGANPGVNPVTNPYADKRLDEHPSWDSPCDTSRLVEMRQNQEIETSQFEKALALFAELTGLSRQGWSSLREVLQLLRDDSGSPIRDIVNLPSQLATLKSRLRKRLPLLNMREADIPLNAEKMPTEAIERKVRAQESSQQKETKAGGKPSITMKLTFFDPPTLIKTLLSSDVSKDIYSGPAIFVDCPTELYHAHCWSGSVRTSSGQYPHMKGAHPDDEVVIFPSDWIYYRCTIPSCFCHEVLDDPDKASDLHIGRVYGFGWDTRTSSCTGHSKSILALQVQECLLSDDNDERINNVHARMAPPQERNELVLVSSLTYIPETSVYCLLDVYCDYEFGETLKNPVPPELRIGKQAKKDIPWPKYDKPRFPERDWEHQGFYVRRMVVLSEAVDDKFVATDTTTVVPLCHTHPIRGELEINTYGRDLFEFEWDQKLPSASGRPLRSLPYLNFIDGFGVFSNSYRSLMGSYITPAGFSATDRFRPGNIFPLVLGPHGSNFNDVVQALGTLGALDKGVNMRINGKETLVCAFTLCFTGDMPQQAENSGLKGPRAHKFCRNCFVPSAKNSLQLREDFDIVQHGRFHHQVTQMQHTMDSLSSNAKKETYGTQWGMSNPSPPLQSIAPALDLILSRPYDPAHSEYHGLSNLMHALLCDGILTPSALASYALTLRNWPFPPGARRLQSPKHHLLSYNMSAHAIWSIIIPAFLRDWLKPVHIRTSFAKEASAHGDPVRLVIETCTAVAKSNTVLMGSEASTTNRANMKVIVKRARQLFNRLCICAAISLGSRPASIAPGQSPGPGGVAVEPTGEDDTAGGSARSARYLNDTLRPNIHIAVHYPDFAEEYGSTVNVNVLTGEDLHRYFKTRVYETNYSNIEHVLLMKFNLQLTTRFVLRNAFRTLDPKLTTEIQELRQKCPNLFRNVLSRSDRNDLANIAEGEDIELEVTTCTSDTHINSTIINRIPVRAIRRTTHPLLGEDPLPTKARNLPTAFVSGLRSAYHKDYGFDLGHPKAWKPSARIQWAHKLGFNQSDTKERFVFSKGNYIEYHGRRNFARIDHIFLFDVYTERHVFAIITPLRRTGVRDELIDLEILQELNGEPLIIGIMAIEPAKPYLVQINDIGVVHVEWSVKWL